MKIGHHDPMYRVVRIGFWLLLAAPAIWQIVLLCWAIGGRFGYASDLEWMEGGVLHGAHRIEEGDGHYPPPSVDFIPFLYTPLYPGLLAVLGSVFGLSYQLGRFISVLSLLGIAAVVLTQGQTASPQHRPAGLAGALTALGLFAAAYPFVEGWYDLVRGDTMFLLMITAGTYALTRWAKDDEGPWAQVRIGCAGAILGLSFFAKQTGIMYVLAAGPIILIYNWRRAPAFVGAAAFVGLGGTWLMQRTTGGWFWTYVYEIHQAHDWNEDRFWKSFDHILLHFRGATAMIVVTLCVVLACAVMRRRLPPSARAFLLWTYMYAVSTVVGAIGWGTEFAHFNAYMPALLHGAIAAGLALPTLLACTDAMLSPATHAGGPAAAPTIGDRVITGVTTAGALLALGYVLRAIGASAGWDEELFVDPLVRDLAYGVMVGVLAWPVFVACGGGLALLRRGPRANDPDAAARRARIAWVAALVCAAAIGRDLLKAKWDPRTFIPTERDKKAGAELIATIRDLPGEVWVPSHPWYAHLAGKRMYAHRMGIKDVTWRKPRPVAGLDRALRERRFDAIVLDNRDIHLELRALTDNYRPDDLVPRNARPRVFTGAKVIPDQIWVPAGPAERPPGVQAIADFEDARFDYWTIYGGAWGTAPVRASLQGQGLVRRYGGRWFATSFHGGDVRTGTLISPPFVIDGRKISMRIGGGADDPQLRVELRIDGKAVRTASPPLPPSERFSDVEWNVEDLRGQTAAIALVDDSTLSWGHLNVDEIWLWP